MSRRVGFSMAITYLQADHHVVRYVPWARLRKNEDDNIVGVLGVAFRLRDGVEFLSATWAEYFAGVHADQVNAAIRTIRSSKVDVRPRSGFAIGNVERIRDVCLADKKKLKIRFIHEREDDNEAHAALRGWPGDSDDLLDLIAEDVWNTLVLNKDVP